MSPAEAAARDAADPLAYVRERFALPGGIVYLDGNSLGPLPLATRDAMAAAVDRAWGERLIRSWNEGWIEAPRRIGEKIAALIGARADEVIVADSTSVDLFKLLVAALRHQAGRHTIVGEAGNFPTDLQIAEGAVGCVPGTRLNAVPRHAVAGTIDDDTAIVMLTHVHYKTGERFDMAAMTATARDRGALMLWDLSHSTGAVPLDLDGAGVDLAVGCTYKYLNGGPGAPAFLFVSRALQDRLHTPLSGWMGHAEPFAFADAYAPAPGMRRWLAGTPPILSLTALETGVDLWSDVDQAAAWAKSAALFDVLVAAGDAAGLECVTPRDPAERGSHVSFRHPHAYAICQALIERGVIGDFRDPDILRLGLTPLYLRFEDVRHAAELLREVVMSDAWRDPSHARRGYVT